MSDQPILLLDAGNSLLKGCQLLPSIDYDELVAHPVTEYDLSGITTQGITEALICSVRDDAFNQELAQKLSALNITSVFVKTVREQHGIVNSYEHVDNMGSDRWLGMLGARAITNGNFIVVDAGTAITIDAVVDNHHIGGWITAGMQTSKQALLANTKRVFAKQQQLHRLSFGMDTPDCVNHGALASIVGLVLTAVTLVEDISDDFTIVLSGGDGAAIFDNLPTVIKARCKLAPNIVITGLASVAKQRF